MKQVYIILPIFSAHDPGPPRFMGQIPVDCRDDTVSKPCLRRPSELFLYFTRIDRIAEIMPFSIRYIGDQMLWFAKCFADQSNNVYVPHFIVATDIVNLSGFPMAKDQINCAAMVFDIKPVPNIQTGAVDRHRFAGNCLDNHQWNQLLRELMWSVIVGATADRNWKAVSAMPCECKQIGAGFGCCIRARCTN